MTTSRFITYPSTVTKENNTVVIIDADVDDIERIGFFCKTSNVDHDIYLYRGDLHDLEWLNCISKEANRILINDSSQVTIHNSDQVTRYGQGLDLVNPLDYFKKFEEN